MKLLHKTEDNCPQAFQNPRWEIEDVGANLTNDTLPVDNLVIHLTGVSVIRHYQITDAVENHDGNRYDFDYHDASYSTVTTASSELNGCVHR